MSGAHWSPLTHCASVTGSRSPTFMPAYVAQKAEASKLGKSTSSAVVLPGKQRMTLRVGLDLKALYASAELYPPL